MGKLTLLFVMIAVAGGSILTFRARTAANSSEFERGDSQADLLAREAAMSGNSLVLNAMLGPTGFNTSLSFTEREVENGRFTVDSYVVSPGRDSVTFSLTGFAGGATHTILSTYEWDPIDFPGPVWVDSPYLTANFNLGVVVDGGAGGLPAYFDTRRHTDLDLEALLPLDVMSASAAAEFAAARGQGGDFRATDLLADGLLEDLNTADAGDLYQAALAAMDADDVVVTGPARITGSEDYGTSQKIVQVTGNLEICGGAVSGTGALVIEGHLTMTCPGSSLNWNGLVIVHSEENFVHIDMSDDATVNIDGALVVDHSAVPPGGHMDVTVNRRDDGLWRTPAGTRGSWGRSYPWFDHSHKFDQSVPEQRTVYFAEEGADRHESRLHLREVLNRHGALPVRLEIGNESAHGFATYSLEIAGQPQEYTGTLINGFGTFSAPASVYQTQPFLASDLETLIVDVRSLRMLRKRWDTEAGCRTTWPKCVGNSTNRAEALTIRLVRDADDALLYEASLYWHMREDEAEADEAEDDAIREAIASGEEFGTQLNLGSNVSITFNIGTIKNIGARLGFDSDELISRGVWNSHLSARDYRAMGMGEAGNGGGPSRGHSGGGDLPPNRLNVCHSGRTLEIIDTALLAHLRHGDFPGACR